jgi:hypothetical protein
MRVEYAVYDYDKFSRRLAAIRSQIKILETRAQVDQQAFDTFVANHPISLYSQKGYIQWQGSDAQKLLMEDLKNKTHDLTVKGGKNKDGGYRRLFNSRPEYHEEFPFKDFCDKVRQEIKTAKYLHTLKVKGKQHKAS